MGPGPDDLPGQASPAKRKVTIEDVVRPLSLHYQGTVYDPYGKFGTEATRGHYRPLASTATASSVLQARRTAPRPRCVQWRPLAPTRSTLLDSMPGMSQAPRLPRADRPQARLNRELLLGKPPHRRHGRRQLRGVRARYRGPTKRPWLRARACWRQQMRSDGQAGRRRGGTKTFSREASQQAHGQSARRLTSYSPRCSTSAACTLTRPLPRAGPGRVRSGRSSRTWANGRREEMVGRRT